MPAVPVVGVLVVVVVPVGVLVVWASAPMGDTAKPNATANPRSATILRREAILALTSEVIFNLLGFSDVIILVWHRLYNANPNWRATAGAGSSASSEIADDNPAAGSSTSHCGDCYPNAERMATRHIVMTLIRHARQCCDLYWRPCCLQLRLSAPTAPFP